MNAWWYHFGGLLNPQEVAVLVSHAMMKPPAPATVGHGGKQGVNAQMRRSKVRWLDPADPDLEWLVRRIEHRARRANAEAFGFDLDGFVDLQFTEYPANLEGHYDWHEDNTWVPAVEKRSPSTRKMSFVCLLSAPESYAGGRLEFERDALPPDKMARAGDAVFFPAFLKHRVTPVTAGVRYSLVTWFEGPQWR